MIDKLLLPSVGEIGILRPMDFLRRVFSGFVCCLLLGISGCVAAQPYPQQQGYRTAPVRSHTVRQANAVPQGSIQQAVYTTDSASSGQQSASGSELYQPWKLNEFPVRSGESGNPYRLVSDTQPTGQKTPPPAIQSSPVKTRTTSATSRSIPVLGIGRAFLDEFRPSNDRKWTQNHAVLQTAEFQDNIVTVRSVRYSRYESAEVYTTQYYDATFNLDDIRTIDLIMVPFQGLERVAHVESSFGFADGRQIGLSIEARYEEGEKYDPAAAGLRQFELVYVLADERDMIRLATDVHKNNVHVYRLNFEPHEVRTMFVDALQRANKLASKPEFYHPLANSCVTNLMAHINKGRPKSVPSEYRTLVPGLLDSYMYDLKLISTAAGTFKEAKEMAKVNWLVERYGDLEYFSAGIRQNMY
ncbi:MAG: DUF4105 domain-containing protein [Planctomycetaceae bacterium]|jgi:hypothetical protein|nr:DUF4105 domain-containing protein [Planctomycetaceae bacterium]